MNSDDDFGQYHCLAENLHGRAEAIVFVLSTCSPCSPFACHSARFLLFLEETVSRQTLPTTSRKPHRSSKHHPARSNTSRKHTRTTTATSSSSSTTASFVEREIQISSSATRWDTWTLWICSSFVVLVRPWNSRRER